MPATKNDFNQSGNDWFSKKDTDYLKKLSREATEKHTNTSLLYFEVDYEKSQRNFYGEILVKAWKNYKGIRVNGIIDVQEGSDSNLEGIPNQLAILEFSCFIDHLKELKINPQIGDYFSTKNKVYFIHKKSILDSNKGQIATNKEAIYVEYICIEVQDDQLIPPGALERDANTFNNTEGFRQYDLDDSI